jgi:hypothetical protein
MIASRALIMSFFVTIAACSHARGIAVGETHTVAAATTQRYSADWPCFVAESNYRIWLEDDSDADEQKTIEENDSIWLSDGDTVKVLQLEKPDTLRLAILSAPTAEYVGKTCWTRGYQGQLFSK